MLGEYEDIFSKACGFGCGWRKNGFCVVDGKGGGVVWSVLDRVETKNIIIIEALITKKQPKLTK